MHRTITVAAAKRIVFISLFAVSINNTAISSEYVIESSIFSQAKYNDNIALTDGPHESVSAIIITPQIRGIIRDKNWSTSIDARLKTNTYTDHDLDSTDKLLNLAGDYRQERNIYAVTGGYSIYSNFNSDSADFGITSSRSDRKTLSFAPSYTRLLNEALSFRVSYSFIDVEYIGSGFTGFIPYNLDTVSGVLIYSLSEIDQLSFTLQASDYESKDASIEYQLYVVRLGLEHQFSETLSGSFQLGSSRRNTTNLNTTRFDFFGTEISIDQEIDFSNNGTVINMGLTSTLEKGSITVNLGRDDVVDSTGGLSVIDSLSLRLQEKLTELWSYSVGIRYDDYSAVSSNTRTSDRELLNFGLGVYYSFARNWRASASYGYNARKNKSDLSDTSSPHSNAVAVGLTYNFPALSTF